jgi:hypothetical protein
MPMYPANPSSALKSAREKHQALIEEFLWRNHKRPDFIYDLQDLESVGDPDQLRDRISWFTQLDDFLEQAFKSEVVSTAFEVNRSISTIVLQLGSINNGRQVLFSTLTSPGLIVDWTRLTTGVLAVAKVSLAEEGDQATGN